MYLLQGWCCQSLLEIIVKRWGIVECKYKHVKFDSVPVARVLEDRVSRWGIAECVNINM